MTAEQEIPESHAKTLDKFSYELKNWYKRHILAACRYCGMDKTHVLWTQTKSGKNRITVICMNCGAKGPDVPTGTTAEEIGKAISKATRTWNSHQPCAFHHCCCCGKIHRKDN